MDGKLLESSYADVLLTDGSDHLFLLSKTKKSYRIINKSGQINKTYFRDLRNDNLKKFEREMDDADFTPVFEEDNPSVAYDIFVAIFTKILNDTCPLRRLKRGSTKFPKKPWITQGILNSISRKNELYKIYLEETTVTNFQQVKNYWNTLNGLKRKAQKCFYKMSL